MLYKFPRSFRDLKISTKFILLMTAIIISFSGLSFISIEYFIIPFQIESVQKRAWETSYNLQKIVSFLDREEQQAVFERIILNNRDLRYIIIIDKDGKAFVHSDRNRVGMYFNDKGSLTAARSGKQFIQFYSRDENNPASPFHGEKVIDMFVPYYDHSGNKTGAINLGISLAKVYALKNMYRIYFGGFTLVLLAIIFFVTKKVLKDIINPLKNLSFAAKKFKENGTITVVPKKNNDDIGAFIDEFNNMQKKVVDDIDDRKKIEIELIKAKEEAESSDRLKSEFLAQMSHEIRTPVNTILSFSSLLEMELYDKVPPDLSEGFRIIETGGQRLIRTIDLILNMSEIQTGDYEIFIRNHDLYNEILRDVFSEFKSVMLTKKLDFSLDKKTEDTRVMCDKYTVTQAIANLIDNAGKYTKSGFVSLALYKAGEKICIDVSDSGIGISNEYISKLFIPFTQEDAGYTRRFEGNGLGLALVKKYCEFNGAEITVKSEKGKGTTFTISFPALSSAANDKS